MPVGAFCAVELGLYFLTEYFPGEPIGALPDLLSGYVVDARDLRPQLRRLRHRIADAARRGYWRSLLNWYMRVPRQWRWFDRTDDAKQQVGTATVFESKHSPYCGSSGVSFRRTRGRLGVPLRAVGAAGRTWPPVPLHHCERHGDCGTARPAARRRCGPTPAIGASSETASTRAPSTSRPSGSGSATPSHDPKDTA